ncbi:unnamed protein product [Trichogramma brassicae]|uniref:RNA-directed DNA polymerase n=1 Tax=Trichogramma brassicae TaxID=86971 RepID=A0A6H5IB28_9HYME|nr:unnamed protein product [Trichogramma brassicae]
MSDDGKDSEKNDDLLGFSNVTDDGGDGPSRATLERFRLYEKAIINLQTQINEQQKIIAELCEVKLNDDTPTSSAPTTSSQQAPSTSNSDTIATSSQLSSGTQTSTSSPAYKFSFGSSFPAHDVKPPPMNPQAFIFTPKPLQFTGNQDTMQFSGSQGTLQQPFGAHANISSPVAPQPQDSAAGQVSTGTPTFNVDRNNNNNNNSTYWAKHVLTIMPTFWQHDPKLWFDMLDSEFTSCRISEDNVKYHILLKSLGNSICVTLSSILHSLPDKEKYSKLKDYLIKKYSKTLQQKIDTLMKECNLGSKKPSELFAEMVALGQGHVPESTTLLLWYRLLPNELAIQLDDAITSLNASSAVEKADRIHQRLKLLDQPMISAVSNTSHAEDSVVERVTSRVIAALSNKPDTRPSRSSSKEKKSPRSRSKSRANFGKKKDLCYYHFRFDDAAKKCASPEILEASIASLGQNSKRLFVRDRSSGLLFLIDTGAEVSVLPVGKSNTEAPSSLVLHAANHSIIHTYGCRETHLNFGFRRTTAWSFIIADIPYPIIGADAISYYGWLPDLKNKQLIDGQTKLAIKGHLAPAAITGISLIDPQHPFADLLAQYSVLFNTQSSTTARASGVEHHLITIGDPIAQRARRLNAEKLSAARKQFAIWCENGTCRPSDSPWASPIHIVPKKTPGEFRVCGDFRKLNAVTQPNKYPVPNLHDFTSILNGSCIYSTLDLYQAFNQIPMAKEDIPKTAVISPLGLFEFLYMPYGLRNASQTFQRYVNQALGDLPFIFVYIDDVLIASNSRQQHESHLKIVLDRLKNHNLRLNYSKCVFGQEKVVFLSHTVSAQGFTPLPDKVEEIVNFPQPRNIDELRRYLGLINFYRAFIKHAAEILAPLNQLIVGAKKKDKTPILWSDEANTALEVSKKALADTTLLAYPKENAELRLVTDASTIAAGAVLEQKTDAGWQALGFYSKKFTSGQKKYAPYDLELTAIFLGIKHFHHELEGREFAVYCDHKPLQYAFTQAPEHAPVVRQRQLAYISQYTTSIKYLPGAENPVADALSRICYEKESGLQETSTAAVSNSSVDAFALPTAFSLEELSEEQGKDDQLPIILADKKMPLPLQKGMWPINERLVPIYYNTEGDLIRPYVPVAMRSKVIDLFHKYAHPGPKSTAKLIKRKYVWPRMSQDIGAFVKNCLHCQQNKISRHTKLIPALFPIPDDRFAHVHIDIVTLQESEGFTYALTMIDRFSRWPEAVPMADMQATTVARAFLDTWVARYGAPETITSDQGKQFEGELFNELCKLLGTNRVRTTPFHPESNGIIERWHRDFKTALMCFEHHVAWTKALPLVMLGLRTRIRSDIDASPAEVLYGSTLRLPGEFFSDKSTEPDRHYFTAEVRAFLKSIRPVTTTSHNVSKPFVHKNLADCSHVFVRANPIKRALESPYVGPFKVDHRPSKYFYVVRIINKAGREELKTVSTSRLQPAFGTFRDIDQFIPEVPQPVAQCHDEAQLTDDFDVVKAPDIPFELQARPKPNRNKKNLQKSANKQSSSQPITKKSTKSQQKSKKKVKFNVEHSESMRSTMSSVVSTKNHVASEARSCICAWRPGCKNYNSLRFDMQWSVCEEAPRSYLRNQNSCRSTIKDQAQYLCDAYIAKILSNKNSKILQDYIKLNKCTTIFTRSKTKHSDSLGNAHTPNKNGSVQKK